MRGCAGAFRNTPATRTKIGDDGRWQCAELADASLLAGGISAIADDRAPCVAYPGSFIPWFKKNGWWTLDETDRIKAARGHAVYGGTITQ